MDLLFDKNSFGLRMKSMLAVDFRRMFTMRLVYIMLGISLAIPILITVMTSMMAGSVSVDPQTGGETVMEGFESAWVIIGTVSGGASAGFDMLSMCNVNLLYFAIAIVVALFVSADYKSGYVKNLFTVRAKKSDYVISKTIVCFVAGAMMMLAFLIGTIAGGAISGLPFTMDGVTAGSLVMCMLSKIFLVLVFVGIALAISIIAKQKTWFAITGSFVIGILLFMMIPMLTPLNASMMNVMMCLIGGLVISIGLGAVSNVLLKKRDII